MEVGEFVEEIHGCSEGPVGFSVCFSVSTYGKEANQMSEWPPWSSCGSIVRFALSGFVLSISGAMYLYMSGLVQCLLQHFTS